MKLFYYSLKSEFYKSRKTLAFWSTFLLPFLICTLVFLIFFIKSKDLLAYATPSNNHSLWIYFLEMILTPMGILILPVYILFVAFSVNNIEHRGDMWKSLFSLPNPKWMTYYSKALFALLLILICLLHFAVFSLLGGNILGKLKPELGFQNITVGNFLFGLYFKLFLASIGILSFQFFMSLIWSDFMKPMGIGFVLIIVSLIALRWQYSFLIPYAQPALLVRSIGALMHNPIQIFTKDILVNLLLAAIAFPLGYFLISKRNR